jgi:hypothetical protein
MQYRFVKTPAGQAEIQARALHLARPVRNLLLILHPGQPASHWLAQVQGCTPDDLVQLESAGLITRSAAPAAAAAPRHPDDVFAALQQRVRATGYAPLYEALNAFGKDTLGLLRGYRFALEVDHCSGPAELQALALRLLERLRQDPDPTALHHFAELLAPR